MALELSDFTKTVLSPEAVQDANRKVAIAYVLIDLLGGKLNSDQKGEYKVRLAQEIIPTDPENPLKSLDEQIVFVEEIENSIKGVEGLGAEAIDIAKKVLIRLIDDTKQAIKESDLLRAKHNETQDRANIVKILESRLGEDAKLGFLKALGIKVSEVVLNLKEVSPRFPSPTGILVDMAKTISELAKPEQAQPQEIKPTEKTKEELQAAVDEVFKRFYATNKRIIPREELKGGLYPLDIGLYEILRKIVNSKDKRITKDTLRKHLGTNYTVQMSRLISTLKSTELVVEEISGYWVARLREDFNPSLTIQQIGGKRIVDSKKKTTKEGKSSVAFMVTEELVIKAMGDKERTNKEIVDNILKGLEGKTKYTRETIENAVYKELARLEKEGTIKKTGKGKRGSPYKYKNIKSEILKVEKEVAKLEEETLTQAQPDTSIALINEIRKEFERKGQKPPTQAEIENPQTFNIFAERFFELFEVHDDALTKILEWGDLTNSDKYLDLLNKLFSYNPRSVSKYMLPKLLIRSDTERELASDEILKILEVPFDPKPEIRKTTSAFVPGEEVEVTTYKLIKFPNIRIGFALSKKGSNVFTNLSGKSVEINRVAGKLWDVLNRVSTAKNSSSIVSGHVIHPINKGLKALKVKANNAVRIYYTVGPITNNGDDLPEEREVFVWGMTDKDEQLEVLSELSYDSIATLRDALSQTKRH